VLSAPLGGVPEVFRNLRNGIVTAAHDATKETAEGGVGLDAPYSFRERQRDFRAQCAVVGQKIQPGMP
jgi:hypothetical protein